MQKHPPRLFTSFIEKLQGESFASTAKKNPKQINESLKLEVSLEKHRRIEIEEKDICIRELREENLNLRDQIKKLKSKTKKEIIRIDESINRSLIEDESLAEIDEIAIIAESCHKLQDVFNKNFQKDLTAIANISKEFLNLVKNGPDSSQNLLKSINQLQQSIEKMSERCIQQQFCSNLTKLKEVLKKEREDLKSSLEEIIEAKVKVAQENQEKILIKQKQLLNSLPVNIKELKQATKKREEDYKRQIQLLQKKIASMSDEHRQTVDTQNKVITQLGQSLNNLKAVYNKQVQIPLFHIRETIEREIKNIKSDFSKMHENTNLNFMIDDLIQSLKRYAQSKNISNSEEMHEEIKKISEKLGIFNEQSVGTISQVREIIKTSHRFTIDYGMISKAPAKEQKIVAKKKEIDEFSLQLKCQAQKEYISMLQLYTKKLEQSVMRTQKQNGKVISEEWRVIEEEYRTRQKVLNQKLAQIEKEIVTSKNQITEIKRAALSIQETEKRLVQSFESFETQIVSIKSFKDELFNFLQNELKFRHEITNQINNFNTFFVKKYIRLSQLQSNLPEVQQFEDENPQNYQCLIKALIAGIEHFNQFKSDYQDLFGNKTNSDYKFYKAFASICQLHDEYVKLSKRKPEKLVIQLDFQSIKTHVTSALHRVEDMIGSTRYIKDVMVKNFNSIKSELHNSTEEFQKIMKFIKQSKLQITMESACQLLQEKKKILHDVDKILSEFTDSRQGLPQSQVNTY